MTTLGKITDYQENNRNLPYSKSLDHYLYPYNPTKSDSFMEEIDNLIHSNDLQQLYLKVRNLH